MKRLVNVVTITTIAALISGCATEGVSTSSEAKKKILPFEQPDATAIIKKDLLAAPKKYEMPEGCISTDKDVIARGSYIFHNLNGKKAKAPAPKGLVKFVEKNGKKKPKQYGNCVACHNIEGAKGGGTVGPDLTGYKDVFVASGVRSHEFVFQKIADARIDNPNTTMTINLTTKLFTVREICDITSYIVSEKK